MSNSLHSPASAAPFAASSTLRRLDLGKIGWWYQFPTVTDGLPPSLSSLAVEDCDLYASFGPADDLTRSLTPFPVGIRHLSLLDNQTNGSGSGHVRRGVFDRLIGQTVGLLKLSISLCAVADLSTSLVSLDGLLELTLVQGRTCPTTPLSAAELITFINSPRSIEKVSVSSNIYNKWSGMEKREVHAAGRGRGVQFLVV